MVDDGGPNVIDEGEFAADVEENDNAEEGTP